MRCNCVIRDDRHQALFAIEVDGKQHHSDRDQIASDKLKDHSFEMNQLPLLRFEASDIRNSIEAVLNIIMVTASERDQRLHTLDGKVDSFYNWYWPQMGDEK